MRTFKDKNINRELIRHRYCLFIGIILIIISVVTIYWQQHKDDVSNLLEINRENENAYIYVSTEPVSFASYTDDENLFYLVYEYDSDNDSTYLYILKMDDESYESLKSATKSSPIKATGVSVEISSELKSLAISSANSLFDDEVITEDNFTSYFGEYYLDLELEVSSPIIILMVMVVIVGFCFLVYGFIENEKYQQNIKYMSTKELDTILKEVPNSYYNPLAKVYFTKNYVVSFKDVFTVIPYKNIKNITTENETLIIDNLVLTGYDKKTLNHDYKYLLKKVSK